MKPENIFISFLLAFFVFLFGSFTEISNENDVLPTAGLSGYVSHMTFGEKAEYGFQNRNVNNSVVILNVKADKNIKEFWFLIKKGKNTYNHIARPVNGVLKTRLNIAYGPGRYTVYARKSAKLNAKYYYNHRKFIVNNYDPRFNFSNRSTGKSRIRIDAEVERKIKEVHVSIEKGKKRVVFIAKPLKNRLTETLYFPFGPGRYTVSVHTSKKTDTQIFKDGLYRFYVSNGDKSDREWLMPSYEVDSDNKSIIFLAQLITRNVEGDMEKSIAIHDWIADNISYDTDEFFRDSIKRYKASETLTRRTGVCGGYSNLFAALHRAVGIKARIIVGDGLNPLRPGGINYSDDSRIRHAWNQAYIDGKWINADVTWDAGYIDYNTKEFVKSNPVLRKYFNVDDEIFSIDHKTEKIVRGE